MKLSTSLLLICAGMLFFNLTHADAQLEYDLRRSNQPTRQTLHVREGVVWLSEVADVPQLSLLYESQPESQMILIDHSRKRYLAFNQKAIRKLTLKLYGASLLLGGLNDQITRLSPDKQSRVEALLNGIPREGIDRWKNDLASVKTLPLGKRTIAGIACQATQLTGKPVGHSELCVAGVERLGLSREDARTLTSLVSFVNDTFRKLRGVAEQFGVPLDEAEIGALGGGIPVQLIRKEGKRATHLTLERIRSDYSVGEPPTIPAGYRAESLKFW